MLRWQGTSLRTLERSQKKITFRFSSKKLRNRYQRLGGHRMLCNCHENILFSRWVRVWAPYGGWVSKLDGTGQPEGEGNHRTSFMRGSESLEKRFRFEVS